MALSPFYGWSEPDNSSLVKNGAADIRTLGDSIDTSVWNIGFGQAAKNKIINADFRVNQRSFASGSADNSYNFDRWQANSSGGTVTTTANTFTLGAAPVAGYEGRNFLTVATSGQTTASQLTLVSQKIESVRTFAGQTATVSFWAKANTGTPKIAVEFQQNFGTGGSPSSSVNTYAGQATLSTSWARYSVSVAVPSISGKTLGTNGNDLLSLILWYSAGSDYNARTGSLGLQNATIDIWGVQTEYGSKATPFQTASGGSPQAELAMCQRYYWRNTVDSSGDRMGLLGTSGSTTDVSFTGFSPVPMRTTPTSLDYADLTVNDGSGSPITVSALAIQSACSMSYGLAATVTGATQFRPYFLRAGAATSYIGLSAELQEMTMDNVTFVTIDDVEHAIIDRGNGEFTSMTKAHYEATQADEASAK